MAGFIAKKSSELRVGDVVVTHGMRVLVDAIDSYNYIEQVRAAGVVPIGFLYDSRRDDNTRPRWNCQGNDLVTWAVEERSLDADTCCDDYAIAHPGTQFCPLHDPRDLARSFGNEI